MGIDSVTKDPASSKINEATRSFWKTPGSPFPNRLVFRLSTYQEGRFGPCELLNHSEICWELTNSLDVL